MTTNKKDLNAFSARHKYTAFGILRGAIKVLFITLSKYLRTKRKVRKK